MSASKVDETVQGLSVMNFVHQELVLLTCSFLPVFHLDKLVTYVEFHTDEM